MTRRSLPLLLALVAPIAAAQDRSSHRRQLRRSTRRKSEATFTGNVVVDPRRDDGLGRQGGGRATAPAASTTSRASSPAAASASRPRTRPRPAQRAVFDPETQILTHHRQRQGRSADAARCNGPRAGRSTSRHKTSTFFGRQQAAASPASSPRNERQPAQRPRRPDRLARRARTRQELRPRRRRARRLDRGAARRGGGPARAQRRRQDHRLHHDHGAGQARQGRDHARRARRSPTLPMFQRGRLGIGYLPQEPSIFRGLTVKGNILAVLEGHVGSRKRAQAAARHAARRVRHRPPANTNALALSGGERRRVEIARAHGRRSDLHAARRALRRRRSDRRGRGQGAGPRSSPSAASASWSPTTRCAKR